MGDVDQVILGVNMIQVAYLVTLRYPSHAKKYLNPVEPPNTYPSNP